MRLIDADELIDRLRGNILIDVTPKLEQAIEQQPTAFDKEKVIEELHNERNPIYREDGSLMFDKTYISIDNAIEIVEKGGIE